MKGIAGSLRGRLPIPDSSVIFIEAVLLPVTFLNCCGETLQLPLSSDRRAPLSERNHLSVAVFSKQPRIPILFL